MELNENDLEGVLGGLPYEEAVNMQKKQFESFKEKDELTEMDLESVTADVPGMPDITEFGNTDAYINEYGEIIREEGRSR